MFKKVNGGILPTRGSKFSACVDLYANEDVVIEAGDTKLVGLGVAIYLDKLIESEFSSIVNEPYYQDYVDGFLKSHYLQLNPRSSLRAKGLVSHTGIIDLDYEEEIKIIIHKPIGVAKDVLMGRINGKETYKNMPCADCSYEIKKGDRIAQITLINHKGYLFGIETEDERDGGFGSTGE